MASTDTNDTPATGETTQIEEIDDGMHYPERREGTGRGIEQHIARRHTAKVCVFKKPARGNRNIRKRPADATTAAADDTQTNIVIKEKAVKSNFISTTEKVQQKIAPVAFQSSGSALPSGSRDQLATAVLEIETEHDKDGVAIQKRGKVTKDDGLYHGINAYSNYIEKRETTGIKGVGISAGPVRASSTIRMTSRMDYQPDLCKDYKETGYCGYGDACKFMHDRGDYKTGWQLEKEWEEVQKRKTEDRASGKRHGEEDEERDGEELPFACFICRKEFGTTGSDPIVTKCKHYFCEKCALDHHKENKKCFICNELTGGIFNRARNLITKLEEKKKNQQLKPQEERGRGHEDAEAEGATVVEEEGDDDDQE